MATPVPSYDESVFINCPFDPRYRRLFRTLLFTIEYCGFHARSALEVDNSARARSDKIIELIRNSRLGIHDISRTQLNQDRLPRFNMPYELGIFVGFLSGGDIRQQQKAALILDREPHRYQRFLSDIAGQDIQCHRDNPEVLLEVVRNWLQAQATNRVLVGSDAVNLAYQVFQKELPSELAGMKKTRKDLKNYPDLLHIIRKWIKENPV